MEPEDPGDSGRFRAIRPEYATSDPADRLRHDPGQVVQCDLRFPPASIPIAGDPSGAPPVLVMVAALSRFITATMLPSRVTTGLARDVAELLSRALGAIPLWWDNESGIGRGGTLTDPVTAFVGTVATTLIQLKPYDPEYKGNV